MLNPLCSNPCQAILCHVVDMPSLCGYCDLYAFDWYIDVNRFTAVEPLDVIVMGSTLIGC